MPKTLDEAAKLIKQAQNNYMYGVEQINKIKAGKSTGLTCKDCNKISTWKSYIKSMNDWANRIRASHGIGMSLFIKAEAGASMFIGGKLGVELKNNEITFSYTSTYGPAGAEAAITGGLSVTNDLDGKMSPWTINAGDKVGRVFIVGANVKKDMKYIEVNIEGGVGVSPEVYFLPVSIEKEFTKTYQLPFKIGDNFMVYPTYNGAPTTEEWINMLNGGGW